MLAKFSLALGALTFSTFAAHSEDVIASGCATKGVEAGCVMLTEGGKTYDISAAVPAPKIGEYGTVTGTVFTGVTFCMQGTRLSPAAWAADLKKSCGK